ncbi:MAG: ABC transporter permease [Candidatus Atribacteria bacterium]|nr:ABC transporter permease [Candidatus Atribacteria bacterium]MCD6349865.1 ABC transporter permease [Candidatus Atribacteria bacterium]
MKLVWRKWETQSIILVVVVTFLIVLLGILTRGRLLGLESLQSIAFQLPLLGILTLAQMTPMLTGGIDLSIIATANLCGVIAAIGMTRSGFSVPLAMVIGLLFVLLFAVLKGILIAWINVPAIIATLGLMIFIRGVSLVLTRGYVIAGFPDSFLFLGDGTLFGIPVPFVIFFACALFLYLLLTRTRFGTYVYLLGSNPVATLFAGVDNALVLFKTYLLSSFLSGMAGLIMIARFNAAQADYGESYLLLTVLACVLGGVDPAGGFGRLPGVVVSIVVLQVVATGFNLLGLSSHLASALWGLILIGVIAVNRMIGEFET